MDSAAILAELIAIEKHTSALMEGLRPKGVSTLGQPMHNGVWWNLSAAQDSIGIAIGRVLRHQQAASEEASDAPVA